MGAEVAPLVFRKPKTKKFQDLTGQKFGLLTVREFVGFGGKIPKWECDCQCGGKTLAFSNVLKQGRAQHCGCQSKHDGRRDHELYATWAMMIQRCENPKHKAYKHYGARGIQVCQRWKDDFWAFAEDMGERPEGCSIDRIDNDGDYEPSNCRWATSAEQASNTRRCRYITYNGETKPMAEWARGLGITNEALRLRLKKDAPISEILTAASGTTLVGESRGDVYLVDPGSETPKWPDALPTNRVLHIATEGHEDSEEIVERLRGVATAFGIKFKSRFLDDHVLVRFTPGESPEPTGQQLEVLRAIQAAGDEGLTDNEGIEATKQFNGYRARRNELAAAGLIVEAGTREGASGVANVVWISRNLAKGNSK